MPEGGQKTEKLLYRDLSYQLVGILFEVYNRLGYGYQEKYYERAIAEMLGEAGIKFQRQIAYKVTFKDKLLGRYFFDFLIDNKIILELKKGNYFSKENFAQVKAYLKASGKQLAILANYTSTGVKFVRVLNPNNLKPQSV